MLQQSMKKRLFGHFGFVYSEIFNHASGMQNVSKFNHVYAKLQQFFVLDTRLYEELSLFHFVSSRALYSKL